MLNSQVTDSPRSWQHLGQIARDLLFEASHVAEQQDCATCSDLDLALAEEQLTTRYVWASADGNLTETESRVVARAIRNLHLSDPSRCIVRSNSTSSASSSSHHDASGEQRQ